MATDVTKLQRSNIPPREPPRELHPAAMQAAADYSRAIDDARQCRNELDQCRVELLAEREIRKHLEQKLAAAESDRDALQRFAIEFTSHIDSIERSLALAKKRSIEFARTQPPKKVVEDMETALAQAADENVGERASSEGHMP